MSRAEAAPGYEGPRREAWSTKDERTLIVDYDDRGVAEVSREALSQLLESAGWSRTESARS